MTTEENPWIKRTRSLTHALMISGGLNICLLATFIYTSIKQNEEPLATLEKTSKTAQTTPLRTNEELLQAYSFLPFSELLIRLENQEPIEEGLSKRDIALACLVAFHHFPLEKSLGGWVPQKRELSMRNIGGQESIAVSVFPGLSDFQFQAVLGFAKTEKWPLSSQGLFYELKRQAGVYDESLLETFYLTPEFHLVSALFSKTGLSLTKAEVIGVLVSGEWSLLSDWMRSQKEGGDLSLETRRLFLQTYLSCHSKIAAKLLYQSDREFALKRLTDEEMVFLLTTLKEEEIACVGFAKELISSPRTDGVRHLALELCPQELRPVAEVKADKVEVVVSTPVPNVKAKLFHTIEAGDNLWKIARKYKVTIEAIKALNHLETEKLRPGKKLEIPTSEKS